MNEDQVQIDEDEDDDQSDDEDDDEEDEDEDGDEDGDDDDDGDELPDFVSQLPSEMKVQGRKESSSEIGHLSEMTLTEQCKMSCKSMFSKEKFYCYICRRKAKEESGL